MSFRLARSIASTAGALALLAVLVAFLLAGCGDEKKSAAAPQVTSLSGLDVEMHFDPG